MSRYISIQNIADEMCVQLGDDNERTMLRCLRAAGRATDEVFNNLLPIVKSEVFEVPDNLVIQMPESCQMITKVGAIDNYGKLILLYGDSNLRRADYNKISSCYPKDVVDESGQVFPFVNLWYQGSFYGEFYTTTNDPMRAGTYRYDQSTNTVEIGTAGFIKIGDHIVIEYKDNSDSKFVAIPIEAQNVIEELAFYHFYHSANPSKAQYYFQMYEKRHRQLKTLYLRQTPEEYIRPFLRGQHLGVK